MSAGREKRVGCALGTGCGLMAISAILGFMFTGAGAFRMLRTQGADTGDLVLAVAMMGLGIIGFLLVLGTLIYALFTHYTGNYGTRQTLKNCRILARYGFNSAGIMLTEQWQFDEEQRPKYYVRLQTGPHSVDEYETSANTYWQCGEGMVGDVEIQGKWIGQFTPYIGSASPATSYIQ